MCPANLFEDKRLIIVNGIYSIVTHTFGAKFLAYRISRQTEHVHFDVRSNLFVAKKLTRKNRYRNGARNDAINLPSERAIYVFITHTKNYIL